jgi:two-component system, OmpR family, response regulator
MVRTCELCPDPPPRAGPPSVAADAEGPRALARRARHVVVVDDDVDTREVLAVILRSAGYRVDAAASGQEALGLMATLPRPPDLAVIDVIMPEMSGYDVIRAMKRTPALADVPVMVISGGPRDPPTGVELDAWLDKPPSVNGLLDAVAAALRKAHVS